jgi:eukaryotic-like serine/threonine-protein kinase
MAEGLAADDVDPDGNATGSAAAFSELRRGTRLGRYELLVPIATGGMARVWAARQHGHRGFTKLVAIKTILPHLAREPEFERMFLDEARIASLVHHPNVAEIYELGEETFGARGRSVLYLAMEWVNGYSLMHLLRSGGAGTGLAKVEPIELRVAARIVADAAAGLHAAHELRDDDGDSLGVVHRDVSPHNLLISADGHVKVADFGVAKALGGMQSHTAAGQIKGKISYMAPEQVTGAPVDRTSDVFALGCVLYEATTGATPFRGEGDHQVMHALLNGKFVMPSKALVGFPLELEKIVSRALEVRQEDRFPSAQALRLALEEWLASTGGMVTTHVAATVRERTGALIDSRKEKIRAASAAPADAELGPTSASGKMGALAGGAAALAGAPASSVPDVVYGSSSGIQRMPGNPVGIGPTYDPRLSETETLPIPVSSEQPAPSQQAPTGEPAGDPRASSSGQASQASQASQAGQAGQTNDASHPNQASHPNEPGQESQANPLANAVQEGSYDPRASQREQLAVAGAGGAALAERPQRYVVAAAIGVATAVAFALLAIFVFHLVRGKDAETPTVDPATTAELPAEPVVSPPADPGSTVVPAAPGSAVVPAVPTASAAPGLEVTAEIVVRPAPAWATLMVDGVRLPAGTGAVPRPAAGKTSVLVVQADGYHEETRELGDGTSSTLDVVLNRKHARPGKLPANPY